MSEPASFPAFWRISASYDPNDHLLNLKGKEYLNVQNRLLWFIRDQRELTVRGLARVPHLVQTEIVELDHQAGYAHFRTTVRDVLGNEATMYGSETAKDFPDYAEKASTKSLGRALLALGYGTAFAPEMDEGERVVDSPVERRQAPTSANSQQSAAASASKPDASTPDWMGWNGLKDREFCGRCASMGRRTVAQIEAVLEEAHARGAKTREDAFRYLDELHAAAQRNWQEARG